MEAVSRTASQSPKVGEGAVPVNILPVVLIAMTLSAGVVSHGAEISRDEQLIRTATVEGIHLAMTPRAAFEHLLAQGFTAGDIDAFDQWTQPGITMVKEGPLRPSGNPTWYIHVNFARKSGRLESISATSQKLDRTHFDVPAEISRVRQHFGIDDSESSCTHSPSGGACQVVDANGGRGLVYGLQVRPTLKSIQVADTELMRSP